ncbi:MAG: glycosyltransferase family 4 protein [Planctomycetaceae bacterium]|nr:glycosyltransferase family 4 protein [Planctomycetaceae bacterium]
MSRPVAIVEPSNLIPYYVRALCRGLIDAGQPLTFYTSRYQHSDLPREEFEEHVYFNRGLSRFLPTSSRLKRILKGLEYPLGHDRLLSTLKRGDADILHLQWARLPRFDAHLVSSARRMGLKYVYTLHDVEPLYDGHGSQKHHRELTLSADALIVHSEWAKRELMSQFPELPGSRISVIEHPPLIQPTQNLCAADCRRRLGIPSDAFHVLFFGSLKAFKGLDFYTHWINQISATPGFERVRFTIAGSPSAPNIEQMIRSRLGDNPRVKLELKYIPESEEEVYFKASDVVALPYEKISQSGVLSTAFAYRKPVLATGVGNFAEQTADGQRGISADADAELWTRELQRMISNAALIEQMKDNIDRYVSEELNWEMAAQKTVRVYETVRRNSSAVPREKAATEQPVLC